MTRSADEIYDELLVLRCQDADPDAFAELVQRWQGRLLAHAMRLTGRRDVAQDVVQETWLAIVRDLHRLRDPQRFAGYAYRIATRRAADWARRGSREPELDDAIDDVPDRRDGEPSAERLLDGRRAHEALGTLPAESRVLIALHYLYDLPLADIAALLRIPRGTVKSRLHRARATLQRAMSSSLNTSLQTRRHPCPTSKI